MSENPTELLQKIANHLEKIEKHLAPPPLWQRLLQFFFSHFATFLLLFGLLYFVFEIWSLVGGISQSVGSIWEKFSTFSGNFKFWE